IASLTARANAIKMLHTRIQLLRSYLTSLPPSYLTTPSVSNGTNDDDAVASGRTEINHPILRSIQALVNRLPLLVPSDRAAFEQESLSEKNDVTLVELLGDITQGTKNLREMGRKFGIVGDAKQQGRRGVMRSMGSVYEDSDELFGAHPMQMGQHYE
ncbi:MAG: hypothetical protein Q9198_009861, partial [Flavoplaca austrocitrina]